MSQMMGFGFIIFVIILIVLFRPSLFRNIARRDEEYGTSNLKALEILGQRYARGEISEDEYLMAKKNILGGERE